MEIKTISYLLKDKKILPLPLILAICGLLLVAESALVQERPETGLAKAEAFFLEGDLLGAKKALQDFLLRQPHSVDALNLLANLFLLEDDFEKASQQINRALKLMPNNPKLLATNGQCLLRQGDFKQAEIQFRKSVQLDSKQAVAHLGLGRLQLTRLKPEEGLASLHQAILSNPDLEDSYFFASEAYGAEKNLPMQIESLQKYLEFKPKFHLERTQNAEALLTFFRSLVKEEPAKINDLSRSHEIEVQPFFGLMLVEAQVNGEGPYRFLVDTGATSTVLSESLLDHLKINPIATAVVKCVGGTGKTATKLSKATKLQVGDLEISNLPIASFNNEIFAGLIDGVLSTADLGDFLITLDYSDKKIVLTPRSDASQKSASKGAELARSEFRILGNLILVPVSINQQSPQNFLLDTGAVTSTLSKRQASLMGVTESTPNSKVDIQFAGACGVTQSVLSVSEVNLKFSGLNQDYKQILAVELKEISREIQTEVSGILGGDFLSKYKVTLDYRDATLTIE
jgi:tetratricopeptide (TPR) repeat protein